VHYRAIFIVAIISFGFGSGFQYLISSKSDRVIKKENVSLAQTGTAQCQSLLNDTQSAAATLAACQSNLMAKQKYIKELQLELAGSPENIIPSNTQVDNHESLEALDINELQTMGQASLLSKVKDTGIKVENQHRNSLKKLFDSAPKSSEWSMRYEEDVYQFFVGNTENTAHQLNQIECKDTICRLEVFSEEEGPLEALMNAMGHESWSDTIRFKADGQNENEYIYYLSKVAEP